jgi:hypothetical protein
MRPKFVILFTACVIGLLAAIVMVKGIHKKQPDQENAGQNPAPPPTGNSEKSVRPVTTIVATTPDEDRQATVDRELANIQNAMMDAESNPQSLALIEDRLRHPDAEVRKEAVQSVVHLNDRGAIEILKASLENIDDPREKVAVMDAIEYLQITNVEMQVIDMPLSTNDLPHAETTAAQSRPVTSKAATTQTQAQ